MYSYKGQIKKVLVWFPVFLMPLLNLMSAWVKQETLSLTMSLIIGAIVEEVIFRFFLFKIIFLPQLKPIYAIIFMSTIFSCMHLYNLQSGQSLEMTFIQLEYAFSFSIWAGATVWKTNTIWPPLISHMLLNATAVDGIIWVNIFVSIVVLVTGIMLIRSN